MLAPQQRFRPSRPPLRLPQPQRGRGYLDEEKGQGQGQSAFKSGFSLALGPGPGPGQFGLVRTLLALLIKRKGQLHQGYTVFHTLFIGV